MGGIHFYGYPVLVAAAVQWVIAAIWYGVIFKKRWLQLAGVTAGTKTSRAVFDMACAFILSVILSFVLANVISGLGHLLWAGTPGFRTGAGIAAMCWVGFIAPTMLTQSLLEKRPPNLFLLNSAYWLIAMAVGGGVLAHMVR